MAENKRELLDSLNLTNQDSIVKILNPATKTKIKRLIPGGANMLSTLDQENLERACFNWLRGTRYFEEVTLSLAKDPSKFRLNTTRVLNFPESKVAIWENKDQGKKYLAKQLASFMKKTKFVSITVKKEGIYVSVDTDNKFSPWRKATKTDVELLLQKDPNSKIQLGDLMKNEEWEPYIEFTPDPKKRSSY